MTTTFIEITSPIMMPGGGVANTGENIGFDPVTAANFIAQGVAVSGSAPSAPSPPAVQRVKIVASFIDVGAPIYNGASLAGFSPAAFMAGDIATFPAALSAALIASGLAVSN